MDEWGVRVHQAAAFPFRTELRLCFALLSLSTVGAFGRWAFERLAAGRDQQPCFSSGTSCFLNPHPRPTSPSRRAHCARRERWGPSFGSWILDSGALSTVNHRGERERFRFLTNGVSESSESVQRAPSVIGRTGRYPVLDRLSSADCAAPPFRWSACPLVVSTFSNVLDLFPFRASISRSVSHISSHTSLLLYTGVFYPRVGDATPHLLPKLLVGKTASRLPVGGFDYRCLPFFRLVSCHPACC